MNILIVEDDLITAASLDAFLTEKGHYIAGIATSYHEAMALCSQYVIDFILLDISLEGPLSGIDFAKQIQKEKSIPFIYITGHTEPQTYKAAHSTSPVAYIVKPYRPEEVLMYLQVFGKTTAATLDETFLVRGIAGSSYYSRVRKKDVLIARASGNYTHLYVLGEPEPFLLTMNLGFFHLQFGKDLLFEASRSTLVNLEHLTTIMDTEVLIGNQQVPISAARRKELLRRFDVLKSR